MRKILLILAGLLMLSFYADTRSEYNVPGKIYSVCIKDLASDGDDDIIFGASANWAGFSGVSMLVNDGSGYFEIDSLYFFTRYNDIQVDHLDTNQHLDLVSQYWGGGVYDQLGIFYDFYTDNMSTQTYDIGYGIDNTELGSVAGPDKSDIIFTVNSGGSFLWGILYQQDTAQYYSEPEIHNLSYPPIDLICANIDKDDVEEIIISGQNIVIFDYVDSVFQQFNIGNYLNLIESADIDKDGDNDLIGLLNIPGSSDIDILENIGNMEFYKRTISDTSLNSHSISIADIDQDSLQDIIIGIKSSGGGQDDGVLIYYNKGDLNFSSPQFVFIEAYWEEGRGIYFADLDGNEYPDLIVARGNYGPLPNNVSILYNDGEGNFVDDPITNTNQTLSQYKNEFKCYPNPFKDDLTIEFKIKNRSDVEVSVYSIKGNLIKKITKNYKKGGKHTLKWRGLDKAGKPCKPGAYIAYLKVNGVIHQSVKIIKY